MFSLRVFLELHTLQLHLDTESDDLMQLAMLSLLRISDTGTPSDYELHIQVLALISIEEWESMVMQQLIMLVQPII